MKIAELVKQEIPILEYAQHLKYTPKKVGGNEYTLAEHDSVRIDAATNLFYRHSTGEGGSIIDFAMMMHGINEHAALSELRGYLLGRKPYMALQMSDSKERASPAPPKKEFHLPPPAKGRFNRVFAYLGKTRGIDTQIISEAIHQNRLYEDDHHNCVFVGYGKDNNALYATKRGTLTESSFKGEVEGSQKIGFYVDNGSPRLFVTESAIDAMSIMTLLKMNGRDYKKYNYLSLGCLSDKALQYRLEGSGGNVKKIFFALDNDNLAVLKSSGLPAPNHGQIKAAEYRDKYRQLGYDTIIKTPTMKDFNEDLQRVRSIVPQEHRQSVQIGRGM